MDFDRLASMRLRIDRIAAEPDRIRAPFVRMARSVLKKLGWQPKLEVRALREFLAAALARAHMDPTSPDEDALQKFEEQATDELEQNVLGLERLCVVRKAPPMAHVAWLQRVAVVLSRIARALAAPDDRLARRFLLSIDPANVAPPLSVAHEQTQDRASDAAGPDADELARNQQRVVGLQLSAIDHLLQSARDESDVLAHRRRLLEAGRQLLLECAAALPLDVDGVHVRQESIARDIARIDRLEAAGVDPDVRVLHQARGALARGDRDALCAALTAMNDAALAAGDDVRAARTGDALGALWSGRDPMNASVRAESLQRSGAQVLGAKAAAAVNEAYRVGRAKLPRSLSGMNTQDREFYGLAQTYMTSGNERATFLAALAVDGCFDVGGVLSPTRVIEHERRQRTVTFPTAELHLVPATDVADIPRAVIDDPRSVLLSLAAGRLLARRFVRDEVRTRSRTVMRGEVRVYVLDGSGSMIGPRARVRDAILLAELATLARRLEEGGASTRVVLHYRYFTDDLDPTVRVDTAAGAYAAMSDVLSTVRGGGTDIQRALVASFVQIREARVQDPELLRAQVVLITDGEAPVDDATVAASREGLGDLPIGVSVVALGVENPALRALVAEQRARGESAFYHHIPDDMLARITSGAFDSGAAIHAPPPARVLAPRETADALRALTAQIGPLLEDLESLSRQRDVEALEMLDLEARARRDVGLSETEGLTEGERARHEAMLRDRAALERRFARWFPTPGAAPIVSESDDSATNIPPRGELDAVIVALSTVAEVIAVVGGTDLARRADAIDLLERLLPEAHLSPGHYASVLAHHAARVAPALRAVHREVAVNKG